MEDVLSVYARPYDEAFPVICMDEKPVQLFANARKSLRSADGRIEYEDNEYIVFLQLRCHDGSFLHMTCLHCVQAG